MLLREARDDKELLKVWSRWNDSDELRADLHMNIERLAARRGPAARPDHADALTELFDEILARDYSLDPRSKFGSTMNGNVSW